MQQSLTYKNCISELQRGAISRSLKITEKSLNFASEASNVFILNGQKFIKNAKNSQCGQTVLPDRSISIGQKLVENAKIQKLI